GLRLGDAALSRDLLERIEVDADEIERLDSVLGQRRDVLGVIAPRENARVDARVQRLHAPAEHLREVRERLDALDVEAQFLEVRGGAAARDELPAELGESPREDVESRLVVGGDQRAHSSS